MGQNEEAAWWEQFSYWTEKREILKLEKKYWNVKLEMQRTERDRIANKERGW